MQALPTFDKNTTVRTDIAMLVQRNEMLLEQCVDENKRLKAKVNRLISKNKKLIKKINALKKNV